MFEHLALLLGDENSWKTTFTGAFTGSLTPREYAARPGQQTNTRRVEGGATPERIGAVDCGAASPNRGAKSGATETERDRAGRRNPRESA